MKKLKPVRKPREVEIVGVNFELGANEEGDNWFFNMGGSYGYLFNAKDLRRVASYFEKCAAYLEYQKAKGKRK